MRPRWHKTTNVGQDIDIEYHPLAAFPQHAISINGPRLCVLIWVIYLNDSTKTEKCMVTQTWCKFGQTVFSYAISQSSELLNCHMWPVNTCYLSSSRVIASFLSRLMGLTFSTILNVQIILDSVVCDFFFLLPKKKKKKRQAATHQSLSRFHRCQVIHHILSVWISNISLQQSG